MKNLLFLAAAFVIFCTFSCKKNTSDNVIEFTYSLDGAHDTSMPYLGTVTMPFTVSKLSGSASLVTLTAPGAPSFLTVGINPPKGTPPFSTAISFTSIGNPSSGYYTDGWGTFPVTILTTADKSYDSSASLHIQILPDDATIYFAATWTMAPQCTPTLNSTYQVTIVKDSSAPNKIIFQHFANTADNISATIDPVAKTITIPDQAYNGVHYLGSGTFRLSNTTQSTINLLYSISSSTEFYNCQASLTH